MGGIPLSIIVALDVETFEEAEHIVQSLSDAVDYFKVHTLFLRYGKQIIDMIRSHGCSIFLDLKFHDIPNTVRSHAKRAALLGVDIISVHCSGGIEMLRSAVSGVQEADIEGAKPKVIGISVLTSLDNSDLRHMNIGKQVEDQVRDLAILGKKAGLDGVVCSPHEISIVRDACGEDFILVVPGIRPVQMGDVKNLQANASGGFSSTRKSQHSDFLCDQKRTMTPKKAMDLGATHLVIGRPIIKADDPKKAAEEIMESIVESSKKIE